MMTKEEKNSLASIIYERYSVGEISLDERENLIKELNNKYIKENTLVEDFEIDEDVLDKLNIFKEAVYEKYSNGEITLETREKLITRANEEFADMYMESDQVNIFKKKIDELRRKNSHKRDEFKKKKMNKFNNEAIAAIKQIIEKNERNLKGLIFCYPHYTHLIRKDAADAVKKLRDIIEEINPVQKSVEENRVVVDKYKETSDEIKKTFKKYEDGIQGYMIQVHVDEFYKNLCEFAKHMTDDINWLESIDKNMYDIVTARSKKIKDKAIYNALNSMYSDYCQFSLFILDLYTTEIYSYLRGISILNKYNKQHKEHELTPEAQRIKNVDNDPMLNSLMKKGSKNKNGYYLDFTDDSNPRDSYTTRKYNLYTSDYDDHIKESAYERYYNGEISLDEFITEKATREQYRMKAFKKKYNYNPKDKSIIVDGEKYYVDLDIKNPLVKIKDSQGKEVTEIRRTLANTTNSEPLIILDNTFFKLKNSGRRDAILKHEAGHTQMHGLNTSKPEFKSIMMDKLVDYLVKHGNCSEQEAKEGIKQAGFFDYSSMSEIEKNKKKIIEDARKYIDKQYVSKKNKGDAHLNSDEIEADRFAANRSSESNLKKGLREYHKHSLSNKAIKGQINASNKMNIMNNIESNGELDDYNDSLTAEREFRRDGYKQDAKYEKQTRKEIRQNSKKELKDYQKTEKAKEMDVNFISDKDKKSIEKLRKDANKTSDYNLRSKALKDPKLRNNPVYKK